MARTLFVSDVHLRPGDPGANASFLRFLAQECEALYIVGDLFDYWIGPKHLEFPDYRPELEALRRAAGRTRVCLVPGNRDFLVDARFERATGIEVLGEEVRLDLGGRRVALAHGDALYNTNPKYSAYRALMRSRPVGDLWRAVPGIVARRLARGYRRVSPLTTPAKAWGPEGLLERARPVFRGGADVLICGHIHQPRHLTAEVDGRRRELFVLGDWCGGTQDYVEHDGGEFRMRRWER
ncbi:MAG TPA: UDP-2,3-diacylglucosamine diphosphatase [Planctomycetota bacterium]|jgi:UDP-2,3-diacylglucosamine hydrolase|nr:UDP-2,3-diacylglucosamine diphosphatase [Planctomycetota bacterium]